MDMDMDMDMETQIYFPSDTFELKKAASMYIIKTNPALTCSKRQRTDMNGHYLWRVRGVLARRRYEIKDQVGEGLSARVLNCYDRVKKEYVVIKVIRDDEYFKHAGLREISLLLWIAYCQKSDAYCVQLQHFFKHHNHVCVVLEKLGPALCDFRLRFQISTCIDLFRQFARELLESVAYLHEDLMIIHTDLKSDNICLISEEYALMLRQFLGPPPNGLEHFPKSRALKLIDFSESVTQVPGYAYSYSVSALPYRAPEVLFGLDWSFPCDIWSVGCILVELYSDGKMFFPAKNESMLLVMMKRVIGPVPAKMMDKIDMSKWTARHSSEDCNRKTVAAINKQPRLQDYVSKHSDHSEGDFLDLLQGLLCYDPSDRLTAREALKHPFFHKAKTSEV